MRKLSHLSAFMTVSALLFVGCGEQTSPVEIPLDQLDGPTLRSASAGTVNTTFNNLAGLTATGTATVKCINQGTHVVVHLSGLRTKGVYTVWVFTYESPGFDGMDPRVNRIGVGALGANDGSQNSFRASASGEGQLSQTMPPGALSAFGNAGACLPLDEFEFHLVVFSHTDGQTHGPVPGPGFPEGGFIFD